MDTARPGSWQRSPLRLSQFCLDLDSGLGTNAFAPAGSGGHTLMSPPRKASSNLSTGQQQDPGSCKGSAGSGSLKVTYVSVEKLAPEQSLN